MNNALIIIVEGADRTGKGTFVETIRRLSQSFKVVHLHSTKPPQLTWTPYKNVNTQKHRIWAAQYYNNLINNVHLLKEHNDIIILDRSYLGEYVYGPLYRNINYSTLELLHQEESYKLPDNTILVYLKDSAENLIDREDGNSHVSTIAEKQSELNIFNTVINNSIISNKIIIDWSKETFNNKTLEQYVNYIIDTNLKEKA